MEKKNWLTRLNPCGISVCVLAAYFAGSFIFSDFSVSAVLGGALLCLWTGLTFLQAVFFKGRPRKWDPVDGVLLGFALLVLVNILRHFSLDRTVLYYYLIVGVVVALLCMTQSVSARCAAIAKWILMGFALLIAAVNILHLFFPEAMEGAAAAVLSKTSAAYVERMVKGGYGIPFGEDIGYTCVALAAGVGTVCLDMTGKNLRSRLPILFVLFLGLLSMQRRSELLVCLVAWGVCSLVKLVKTRKGREEEILDRKETRRVILMQVICIVLAILIFFLLAGAGSRLGEQLRAWFDPSFRPGDDPLDPDKPGIHDRVEEVGNGRLILWELAWKGFLEKPIFGHGWGAFAKIAPASGNTHAINAHCVFLQLLCETGIVGFVLMGGIFVALFWLILRRIKHCPSAQAFANRGLGLYLFLSMMGLGTIENSLYRPYWILLLGVALLLAFRTKETDDEKENHADLRDKAGSNQDVPAGEPAEKRA